VRHAARLRAEGNDVFIGGVPAYSTLVWLDDPLLSTFIRYPDAELARLVFHELSHQLVYVKGDSTFNESFAVAVEREGVRRWLQASGRAAELQLLADAERRRREFAQLLAATRERLERLYLEPLPPETMRARKAEAFIDLKSGYESLKAGPWKGFAGYDRFFAEQAANNALLASFATYTQFVDGFERLLAAEGGDLAAFYAKVKALAALEAPAREAALRPR
jgi:predicted aminopeptidase